MAGAMTTAGSKLMQEIYDQFLICKICFEPYKRPKTLVCLHIFCTECLEKHQEAEMDRAYRYMLYSRALTCPICRRKTELPSGGVRRLPDNFLVANLTETVSRRRASMSHTHCEICRNGGSAPLRKSISKCLECNKMLCEECVRLHQRTKVTAAHNIIDTEVEKDIECKVHQGEVLRFYCEPCEVCICILCTFQEHKGHEVSSFTEGIERYKDSLDSLVACCKSRIGDLREQIDMIQRCESVVRHAEDQIKETAIASISTIKKREKEMLDNVKGVYGDETLEYLQEKASLQEVLDSLMTTCSLTDIVIKDKSIELLLLKKEIQGKLEVLMQRKVDSPPATLKKKVKFQPGSLVFGYLEVDNKILDPDGASAAAALKRTGYDAIIQTDDLNMMDLMEMSGSMGSIDKISQGFATDSFSQSDFCNGLPTIITQQARMLQEPVYKDSDTMTEGVQVMKRKIQTDAISSHHKETDTFNLSEMTDSCTNTKQPDSCTRSTLTIRQSCLNQVTDTSGLVNYEEKGTGTQHRPTVNTSMLTESVDQFHRATLTDVTETADKKTSTSKIVMFDKETHIPLPTMLDMGTTVQILGENKAVGTITTVTTESGIGDFNAYTCDQEIDAQPIEWAINAIKRPRMSHAATMYEMLYGTQSTMTETVSQSERACSPCRYGMIDMLVGTPHVTLVSSGMGTDSIVSAHKGLMCCISPTTSDKSTHVLPSARTFETQTDLSFSAHNLLLMPNLIPCEKGTATTNVEVLHAETETESPPEKADIYTTTEGVILTNSTETMTQGVDCCDATTSMPQILQSDKGFNTQILPITCESSTETQKVISVDMASDAYSPICRDVDVNTVTTVEPSVGAETCEVEVMTDEKSVADCASNTTTKTFLDMGTTMFSYSETADCSSETNKLCLVDFGANTSTVSTTDQSMSTESPVLINKMSATVAITTEDASMETTKVFTVDAGVGHPSVDFATTSTNTKHVKLNHRNVGTEHVETEDRGVATPYVVSLSKDTSTDPTITKDMATSTFMQTVEKATYMPQTVIITTGTCTPQLITLDKKINTNEVLQVEAASMTHMPKMLDSETSTVLAPIESRSTSMPHLVQCDTATDAEVGFDDYMQTATNTPIQTMTDNFTNMTTPIMKSMSVATTIATSEKETATAARMSEEAGTMTHIDTVEVGVLKRPHTMSRASGTRRVKLVSRGTKAAVSGIDDSEYIPAAKTSKFTEDRQTSPVRLLFETEDRASSPFQSTTHEMGTWVSPATSEQYTETFGPQLHSKCTATTTVQFIERGCSPVGFKTEPERIIRVDGATSPVFMDDIRDIVDKPTFVDRACTPVRCMSCDAGVMAIADMVSKATRTQVVKTRDGCSETMQVPMTDQSTTMPYKCYMEKETWTPRVHTMHRNTETESLITADKHTTMDVDVTAKYKDLITPVRGVTISRGTCTNLPPELMDRETSPHRFQNPEKATSPVRIIYKDKGINVSNGQLKEPVDKFCKAGGVMKRLLGADGEEIPFVPELETIREDSKEASPVSDEDGRLSKCTQSQSSAEYNRPAVVHREMLWAPTASVATTAAGSTFATRGQSSNIKCSVETGTSTLVVTTEDKAISTETISVGGRMAECISKLRTVRQRLEGQCGQSSSQAADCLVYSTANITSPLSVSLPSSSGPVSLSPHVSGIPQHAETNVTTMHKKSMSAGDSPTEVTIAPFLTPPARRRKEVEPVIVSPLSPDLGRSKARKQRLDMSQLLRSSSAPEAAYPPYELHKPKLHAQAVTPHVIPKLESYRSECHPTAPQRRHRPPPPKDLSSLQEKTEKSELLCSSPESPTRLRDFLERKIPSKGRSLQNSKEGRKSRKADIERRVSLDSGKGLTKEQAAIEAMRQRLRRTVSTPAQNSLYLDDADADVEDEDVVALAPPPLWTRRPSPRLQGDSEKSENSGNKGNSRGKARRGILSRMSSL